MLCIHPGVGKPSGRGNGDAALFAEPGPPPGKAGIGDDMVTAQGHEMHVVLGRRGQVQINHLQRMPARVEILARPLRFIAEHKNRCLAGLGPDARQCSAVILRARQAVTSRRRRIADIITTADMHGNGGGTGLDTRRKRLRAAVRHVRKSKILADLVSVPAEVVFALPIAIQMTRGGKAFDTMPVSETRLCDDMREQGDMPPQGRPDKTADTPQTGVQPGGRRGADADARADCPGKKRQAPPGVGRAAGGSRKGADIETQRHLQTQ